MEIENEGFAISNGFVYRETKLRILEVRLSILEWKISRDCDLHTGESDMYLRVFPWKYLSNLRVLRGYCWVESALFLFFQIGARGVIDYYGSFSE